MNKKVCIAIDGPAAAGKSTVAKVIAKNLGYVYIDTGAMYRALTYAVLENNQDPKNEDAVFEILQSNTIRLVQVEGTQRVLLNDIDVSDVIRSPQVTNNVSFVAIHPKVRDAMVKQQQELAKNGGVVMDGRDICSYVLPFAEVKIFLIASVAERAERRHRENIEKGFSSDLEVLKAEIAKRDEIDSTREIAPLKKAPDAIEIDTSSSSIEQVVDAILAVYNEKTQNINN